MEFAHWMLREIFEQPEALRAGLARYVADGKFTPACEPVQAWLRAAGGEVVIAASGSSRHAGLYGEAVIEEAFPSGTRPIHVDVEYASEYAVWGRRGERSGGVLVVSQSGETADTLAALRKAKAEGRPTLAITNVAGSSMAMEADAWFGTEAGRERAVPATKSFTTQLLNFYLLGRMVGGGDLGAVEELPGGVARQLAGWDKAVQAMVDRFGKARSFLFLGRGVHYAVAREGALKLKESAYVHAEGYPAGELKHGPNALVDGATPLVVLATVDHGDAASVERYSKTVHLLRDMRAQGATVIAIGNVGDAEVPRLADEFVAVDAVSEGLLPICEVVPLQMFAYYMALARGVDVDAPRNLTKAVVVE